MPTWDLPDVPVTGTIATVVNFGVPVRDCLSYLKSSTVQEVFIPPSIFNYANAYYEWMYPCILVVGGSSFNAGMGMLFSMKVPDDFVSFNKVEIMWAVVAAGSSLQTQWDFHAAWVSSGESMAVVGHATSNTEDTGYGLCNAAGADCLTLSQATNPLTLSGLARGDYLSLGVFRSTCSDTIGGSVYVHGLLFSYTGLHTST